MQTVTSIEIAERIKRTGETLTMTTNRIKYWTRDGLLSTDGNDHPGTGRVLHYRRIALVEAALVQVLTEMVGVSVGKVTPYLNEAKRLLRPIIKSESIQDHVLLIGRSVGISEFYMTTCHLAEITITISTAKKRHDAYHIVNLKRLLDR